MLDFVLTFSLPKLVFDNEVCGQALHFVREMKPLDDLPTADLVEQLMRDDHLITAAHTLKHWPQELYLTDVVIDRANREAWEEDGSLQLYDRACEQVEKHLASYIPVETDAAIDAEMRKLVQDGLEEQLGLPELPPVPDSPAPKAKIGRRGRAGRRRRGYPS
jgi:trimethylamine--corrinoid protein Co-methyltransferase